jgi:hypothetical protein
MTDNTFQQAKEESIEERNRILFYATTQELKQLEDYFKVMFDRLTNQLNQIELRIKRFDNHIEEINAHDEPIRKVKQ